MSARHAVDAEVRLYDRLFSVEDPEAAASKANAELETLLNPASLDVISGCKVEPMLGDSLAGARYQFERLGYFAADPDTSSGRPVFNRTVSLKGSTSAATR